MRALLVSTYDLGRQPFGLASPAAWLRRAGVATDCADTSRERLTDERIAAADLVAFYLPMHTATRLAAPLIDRVRRVNPSARIAAYGLYAPLNAEWLRERGVTDVLGPEAEAELVSSCKGSTVASGAPNESDPSRALPAGPRRASAAHALRGAADARRLDARRRQHRRHARLQASLPALPDRAGLPGTPVPRRAGRRRHRRHPRAGRGRRAAHQLRRSGFSERPDARAAHHRARQRASSRASPTTSRSRSSTS